MKIIAGLFGTYLIYMSFRTNGLVLSEDVLSIVVGFACIWYACKDIVDGGEGTKGKKRSSAVKSNVQGRSCFDCKNCNSTRVKKDQVYCNWDNEYYYPETGRNCDDFNK